MTPAELGTTIRRHRERAGLTQDGLGQLIAVDPDLIDQWEWGEERPADDQAERIAEVLGIPVHDVLPPEVVVEVAPPSELKVEFLTSDDGGAPPAPPPPPSPATASGTPARGESLLDRVRSAILEDPRRSVVVAVGAVVVLVVLFLMLRSEEGELAAPPTATPTTVAGADGGFDILVEQRDALADQVAGLEEDLASAEERAAAAEEEARRLAELAPPDDLVEENQRLQQENELLRKAVVVSSAADGVEGVALTFDGSGSPEAIGAALDTFAAKGVTATFFPTGQAITANPELWRRVVEEGHELGNNTFSNAAVTGLDEATLRSELVGWIDAASDTLGDEYRPFWFRPPFMDGFTDRAGSEAVRGVLADLGMVTALWNVETYFALFAPNGPQAAGPNPGAADVAAYVAETAGAGSIVLLSTGSLDVAALPGIIDGIREQGLEPTSLTGLFALQEEMLEGEVGVGGDTADA